MHDITMCQNTRCPLTKNCKRSELSGTKPDEKLQSYAIFVYDFYDKKCEYYYPLRKVNNLTATSRR